MKNLYAPGQALDSSQECDTTNGPIQTLTIVTFKSRSNEKPVYYVMYPYQMYLWYKFGDDPAISSGE
jgi:hypothetical protein